MYAHLLSDSVDLYINVWNAFEYEQLFFYLCLSMHLKVPRFWENQTITRGVELAGHDMK